MNFSFLNNETPINDDFYIMKEEDTIQDFDYKSIYRSEAFTEAMNHFNIEDKMTRSILLSVNEADQNTTMVSLANKLYEHIVNKVDDIDFGTISLSKGDITKIDHYEEICNCIQTMGDIIQQYNQNTDCVEIIALALQNLLDRVDMFTKAYKLNVEMPIIIYNTMALSVVSATSYMITSCIEFIKNSNSESVTIALDKTALIKSRDCLLYNDLDKFNKLCSSGKFDKSMDYVINQNGNNLFGALGAAQSAAVIGILLLSIIPLTRELIFFFYYTRYKMTDYFDSQSALIMINAYNIEHNLSRDEKERKKIAEKQRSIADKFKKIANFFRVKSKTAEANTTKDIKKLDSVKYNYSDISSGIPDSSNATLF